MTESGDRPRTARAPGAMATIFSRVEEAVADYYRRRIDDPERGTIEIFGERYLLLRAASLSVEFFGLVRELFGPEDQERADDFSRNFLFDLSHAVGRSDARRFHERMNLVDPIERLAAGPLHFSHSGWAFVNILPGSRAEPGGDYHLVYEHPYSFEADAWLAAGVFADFPVCIMSSGYSSGWCQESFGQPLVASEICCRARGDESCRFVMAPPERIEDWLVHHAAEERQVFSGLRDHRIPDFFARKRMEDDLRRARDELELRVAERTAELERANELLRQEIESRAQAEQLLLQTAKLEAVGRLAGGIAHDFNNLMGVVIGHVSLLENRRGDEAPGRAHLAGIRQAGEEASRLTQQLLAFSRAQLPRKVPVDLNGLIRDTAEMLGRLISEDILFETALGEDAGVVEGDAGQLAQVVMNLVMNARDAMPGGGRLRIETSRRQVSDGDDPRGESAPPGDWLVFTVRDTGTGMSGDILERAFEPFFSTKDAGCGSGLGLPLVQRIVTQCGGEIRVDTAPGAGCTFHVYLPRAGDAAPGDAGEERERDATGGGETVLLVEDRTELREIVDQMLRRMGYEVFAAADAADALALAAGYEAPVHLLLTDVIMPGMNGRELWERLAGSRPGIRVLYMTGYAEEGMLGRGAAPCGAAMLLKPFTIRELAARVREVLDA